MRKCRYCGNLKAPGDPCNRPDCPKPSKCIRRGARSAIIATKAHGYHAPTARHSIFGGWA